MVEDTLAGGLSALEGKNILEYLLLVLLNPPGDVALSMLHQLVGGLLLLDLQVLEALENQLANAVLDDLGNLSVVDILDHKLVGGYNFGRIHLFSALAELDDEVQGCDGKYLEVSSRLFEQTVK